MANVSITPAGGAGATAASQAQMEAATDNTVMGTPANHQQHPSSPKVWGQVAGAGTSIAASYNVGSITDVGTGVLTVTLTTNFSSTSYAILSSFKTTVAEGFIFQQGTQAVDSFQLACTDTIGTPRDPAFYNFACFGDQ